MHCVLVASFTRLVWYVDYTGLPNTLKMWICLNGVTKSILQTYRVYVKVRRKEGSVVKVGGQKIYI